MNVVNMIVDFEGIIADANAAQLKGGASVKSPRNVVDVDAYVAYGIPKTVPAKSKNEVTISMNVKETCITAGLDQALMFTLLPEYYAGTETTLDWLPDENGLLTKETAKKKANCDCYMSKKEGTNEDVIVTVGCTDADGQPWVISWDPIIIIRQPPNS
jgi:hypothetical protein